ALGCHEQAVRPKPGADVAVVRGRVPARVHAAADFDDVGPELGFTAHAVRPSTDPRRARYLSRQASEQKNTRDRPSTSSTARSASTNVPHTGSRTIGTPRGGTPGCPP